MEYNTRDYYPVCGRNTSVIQSTLMRAAIVHSASRPLYILVEVFSFFTFEGQGQ